MYYTAVRLSIHGVFASWVRL